MKGGGTYRNVMQQPSNHAPMEFAIETWATVSPDAAMITVDADGKNMAGRACNGGTGGREAEWRRR